jgi:hypothetical protein
MAFQGSLAELNLPDIIQLVSVSGKTGVFQLTRGPHKGQIYLSEGQIVHAQFEEMSGEEAVYALAMWKQGDFRFEPGGASTLRTISKSNTNLLMEAARRLDEWRVLSKKIPSTDLVPEFVLQEKREGQINLNTSEWLILSRIDGNRSVKQIASACGLPVFDAAKILYGLVATSLIRLRDAEATGPMKALAVPGREAVSASAAANPDLVAKLDRIREISVTLLGGAGENVVSKHYQKARAELDRGAGPEAVDEAVSQITRAASILKGPAATEALVEQLKAVR